MADTKISALTALTGANVDSANDVLPIVDTSVTTTKKITRAQLFDISDAAGGQIVFPATQNASGNANTLDDYEEGIWTPANPQVSLTVTSATYTKVGRMVTIQAEVTWLAGSADAATVTGLPFTAGAQNFAIAILSNQGALVQAYVIGSTAVVAFANVAGNALTNTNLNGALVRLCGSYFV